MPERPCTVSEQWTVVRTHPRQECRAEESLRVGGIETFLPRLRSQRQRSGRSVPLFPQYLFARFDPESRLRDVVFARGVHSVLRACGAISTIDESVIVFLQSRVDENGFVRIGDPLQRGDKVVVENGPFASLVGVVERVLPEKDRVTLLLTAVQSPLRIDVASGSVRRLAND